MALHDSRMRHSKEGCYLAPRQPRPVPHLHNFPLPRSKDGEVDVAEVLHAPTLHAPVAPLYDVFWQRSGSQLAVSWRGNDGERRPGSWPLTGPERGNPLHLGTKQGIRCGNGGCAWWWAMLDLNQHVHFLRLCQQQAKMQGLCWA